MTVILLAFRRISIAHPILAAALVTALLLEGGFSGWSIKGYVFAMLGIQVRLSCHYIKAVDTDPAQAILAISCAVKIWNWELIRVVYDSMRLDDWMQAAMQSERQWVISLVETCLNMIPILMASPLVRTSPDTPG
jgi:hypothetical protein